MSEIERTQLQRLERKIDWAVAAMLRIAGLAGVAVLSYCYEAHPETWAGSWGGVLGIAFALGCAAYAQTNYDKIQ